MPHDRTWPRLALEARRGGQPRRAAGRSRPRPPAQSRTAGEHPPGDPRPRLEGHSLAHALGISEDRILSTSGGVAFFALLAVFPAMATIVSLYGLFADTSTIRGHLSLLASIRPAAYWS